MSKNNLKSNFFKDYYFVIIPLAITILIYSISLTYGFRSFDEDVLIKNFYVKKTFLEYLEKLFLIHLGGFTEAHGFTFSSIQNTHVSIFGIPVFYIISFLFKAKPFLFHLWSLILHCLAVCSLSLLVFNLTKNKLISLFSSLLWTLHPTNVEPVIWATNWAQPLGAALYFYTISKIVSTYKDMPGHAFTLIFVLFITLVQILFTEHTITIPLAILITALYFTKDKIASFKISLSSFIVIAAYWILRNSLIAKSHAGNLNVTFNELFERIIFLSPQVFLHELKLIFFPKDLSIDQIDLLSLDQAPISIIVFVSLFILSWITKNKFKNLSYGLILYIVTLLPFVQIIPLYSLAAERYNYFGSAFLLFGITATACRLLTNKNKIFISLILVLCILFGTRSFFRITEWKDSQTLFLSTINTSKSLLKKGIWIYNLAITQKDKKKGDELLNLSCNLLKLFIQNYKTSDESPILKQYELDKNSLLAKAALRLATNYEILDQKKENLDYLIKALNFSQPHTIIQSLIYKNLGTYYFQNNKYEKSLEYYTQSYKISRNSTIAYTIALCYSKLNDTNNYEKFLKEATRVISPFNVSPYKAYGQFLELSRSDYEGAKRYYKIATLLENSPEPYILLSTLYLKLNQIKNAHKIVQRGLHSFSNNPSLTYLNGAIKLNRGDLKGGIKELKRAIQNKDCPKGIKIEASSILGELIPTQ